MTDPELPSSPPTQRDVQYKGEPLDAARGPGLGCFWTQVAILAVAVVLAPLSAVWNWPVIVSIVLLATMLVMLLFVGQTSIFLMRLVAADRRAEGRRRPMRSATPTVGQIEDEVHGARAAGAAEASVETSTDASEERHVSGPDGGGGVRE